MSYKKSCVKKCPLMYICVREMEVSEKDLHIQEMYYSMVLCSMWHKVIRNKNYPSCDPLLCLADRYYEKAGTVLLQGWL